MYDLRCGGSTKSQITNRQSYVANLTASANFLHCFNLWCSCLSKPEPAQRDLRLTIYDIRFVMWGSNKSQITNRQSYVANLSASASFHQCYNLGFSCLPNPGRHQEICDWRYTMYDLRCGAPTNRKSQIVNRTSQIFWLRQIFTIVLICGVAACLTRAGIKRFTIDDIRCTICDVGLQQIANHKSSIVRRKSFGIGKFSPLF